MSQTELKIELATWGTELFSRVLGTRARDEISIALDSASGLRIDCAGVETISPSFADEFFGKLSEEIRVRGDVRLSILNLDASNQALVRQAIATRRRKGLPATA